MNEKRGRNVKKKMYFPHIHTDSTPFFFRHVTKNPGQNPRRFKVNDLGGAYQCMVVRVFVICCHAKEEQ